MFFTSQPHFTYNLVDQLVWSQIKDGRDDIRDLSELFWRIAITAAYMLMGSILQIILPVLRFCLAFTFGQLPPYQTAIRWTSVFAVMIWLNFAPRRLQDFIEAHHMFCVVDSMASSTRYSLCRILFLPIGAIFNRMLEEYGRGRIMSKVNLVFKEEFEYEPLQSGHIRLLR